MKVLFDTSFIVAFLFEGDVFHKEAVKRVKRLTEEAEFCAYPS
jgi:predicted nucleic acid-binding protein